MKVTQEMKQAGARLIADELGFQFSPEWLNEEDLAESIFQAMLALSSESIQHKEDQ